MSKIKFDIRVDEEKIIQAIKKLPREIALSLKGASSEVGNEVLNTEGLRLYPPHTRANLPPTPYYVRGTGTQVTPSYNRQESEQYGKRWRVKPYGSGTLISNSASYAKWISGEEQKEHMAEKGWRKLSDVVRDKAKRIRSIYERWITRALRRAGLK